MCIYKDGTHLATASNDTTVKLIDTQTLEHLRTYNTDRPANAVALSPIFDQVCITGHAMQGHVIHMLEACRPIALRLKTRACEFNLPVLSVVVQSAARCTPWGWGQHNSDAVAMCCYAHLQVLIGGGQDAADVTTTSDRAGGFQSRFFHKVGVLCILVWHLTLNSTPIWSV